MTDTLKALDEIEALLSAAQRNTGQISGYEDAMNDLGIALALLPTLRAALTPVADDVVREIERRHTNKHDDPDFSEDDGYDAHNDRWTLLSALRQREAEVARFRRTLEFIAQEQSAATATEAADKFQRVARAALGEQT